jgi:hypothetical protein
MFISKAEKEDLFYRIAMLEQMVSAIRTSLAYTPEVKTRKGRSWSPEQRAHMSTVMKARHVQEKSQKENV